MLKTLTKPATLILALAAGALATAPAEAGGRRQGVLFANLRDE